MLIAAALCPAPPLLARELTGADPVVPELRQACLDATVGLLSADPGLIAVVGVAGESRSWAAAGQLDLTAFAPALAGRTWTRAEAGSGAGAGASGGAVSLPVSLGLGSMLLDQAGFTGRRALWSVTEADPPTRCAALGARLAGLADRVALLVMADGSARRTLKAPGYLDRRSEPFDAAVERAIRVGGLDELLVLEAELARELMATGRPAWQVLAGAASGKAATQIRYRDAPFGVFYLVASLSWPAAERDRLDQPHG